MRRDPLPQRRIEPGLPARALSLEMIDHVLVQSDGDLPLVRSGRTTAPDDRAVDLEVRRVEPCLGQFRGVVRVHPIGLRTGLAHDRSPFASI